MGSGSREEWGRVGSVGKGGKCAISMGSEEAHEEVGLLVVRHVLGDAHQTDAFALRELDDFFAEELVERDGVEAVLASDVLLAGTEGVGGEAETGAVVHSSDEAIHRPSLDGSFVLLDFRQDQGQNEAELLQRSGSVQMVEQRQQSDGVDFAA